MYFDPSPPQSPMSGTHRSRRGSCSTKSSKSKSSSKSHRSCHSSRSSRSNTPDVIAQALQNTLFLHPASSPSIITSRDASGNSRTIIISSSGRILFQQPGTSSESYAELLAATERGVHDRLLNLDGASSEDPAKPVLKQIKEEKEDLQEKVEEIRRSVDLARLQRENEQLLSQLAAQRAPMQLTLPERKIKTTKPSISQPEHRANIGGLPKSRAQMSRNKPILAAPAWTIASPKPTRPKTPGSMLGARRWGEECEDVKAWLKALSDGGEDEFESVSSAAELAQERRKSLMKAVEITEREEAKVEVKEVKAITPPLTPPPVVNQLPRSRAFRGRA